MISTEYAAGFFDGEGSITLMKPPPWGAVRILRVVVVQNDRRPLDLFMERWGGHVRQLRKCYQWQVATVKATSFLEDVLPHLIVKHYQAELALKYRSMMRPYGGKWEGRKYTEEELVKFRDIEEKMILSKRGVST